MSFLCYCEGYTSDIKKNNKYFLKKRGTYTMIINAILLTIGLVGIPAAICANTELTCGAAA